METQLTPRRPYLVRAYYDWLLDNELTPHLVVDATQPQVVVPQQYVQDGQIVLNLAPRAVMAFSMDNHAVSFNARFGGTPFQVYIPMAAILAIYARENGAGTVFEPESAYLEPDAGEATAVMETEAPEPQHADGDTLASAPDIAEAEKPSRPKAGRAHLKVIK